MNTYTVTKAMIDATVERGIRDMQEDPHRSMRRLADIGRQFSRGRFQEYSFSIIQELLQNENSAYYDMVQNVLRNSDHRTLRVFGVNTTYLTWTYGARRIREFEQENGFCVSCSVMLRYDPAAEDGLRAEDIEKIIREGSELGIYSYYIRQMDTVPGDYRLLSLFEKYRDCAFLWIHETGRITAAQVQLLSTMNNTLLTNANTLATGQLSLAKTTLESEYGAYFTALTICSSAATIPVTMRCVRKNGVSEETTGLVAPLCATIHLAGSTVKVVSCAVAFMVLAGRTLDFGLFTYFIFMMAITAVAAPGVACGVIMSSLGLLESILGFTPEQCTMLMTVYVAMDGLGTACNVAGDGAIAVVVDRFFGRREDKMQSGEEK